MLAEHCDTLRDIFCQYAPHEAGKFSGNSRLCHIGFLVFIQNQAIVSTAQAFISFVCVSYDGRIVSLLSGFQSL